MKDDSTVDGDSEPPPKEFQYQKETYAILGACFAVYKEKGCGFMEAVYQKCLEIELTDLHIPFVAQPQLELFYKGIALNLIYVPDFLCYDHIIIELKTVTRLAPEHRAQTMNYLRATQRELGLLVNFGHYPQVEHERIIATTGRYTKHSIESLRNSAFEIVAGRLVS